MTIAIIDYGSGNLSSAAKAFERAAAEAGVSAAITVTDDAEAVRRADRIVLPGVGAFADCMAGIRGRARPDRSHGRSRAEARHPFLGICVGMQLMAERGLRIRRPQGLGWIKGEVVPLEPADTSLKIPHMGWNELHIERPDHPVLAGIPQGEHAYFVHSYRFACTELRPNWRPSITAGRLRR